MGILELGAKLFAIINLADINQLTNLFIMCTKTSRSVLKGEAESFYTW